MTTTTEQSTATTDLDGGDPIVGEPDAPDPNITAPLPAPTIGPIDTMPATPTTVGVSPDPTQSPDTTAPTEPDGQQPTDGEATTTVGNGSGAIDTVGLRRQCNEKARNATVAFQPEKRMVLGQAERLEAIATVGELKVVVDLEGDSPPEIRTGVTLGCQVQAKLVGLSFDISPNEWTEKSFLDQDQIEWEWQVRAIQAGVQPLTLELQPFLLDEETGELTRAGNLEPLEIEVEVIVSETRTGRFSRQLGAFFSHPFWGSVSGLSVVLVTLATGAGAIWTGLLGRPMPAPIRKLRAGHRATQHQTIRPEEAASSAETPPSFSTEDQPDRGSGYL